MDAVANTDAAAQVRRDQLIVFVLLAAVILACWIFFLNGTGMRMTAFEMTRIEIAQLEKVLSGEGLGGGKMMVPVGWTFDFAVVMFFMWCIMMTGMMLPTITPMVLKFAAISRKKGDPGGPTLAAMSFSAGYLAVWAGFCLAAVFLQWALQHVNWLTPMLVSTSGLFDEVAILAAGIYQFTPMQRAGIDHCRSCADMMPDEWRGGLDGALRMGFDHGVRCLTVCWVLMGLLFVAGVMNVYLMFGLSLLILLEKTLTIGRWIGYAAGAALIALALWSLSALL